MKVSLIAAVSENGIIGRDGALPWHLSADLQRFKAVTMGHHVIVGRKTFATIGRPLPGRKMIVVSTGAPQLPPEVRLAHSLEAALEMARADGETEAFIAGGGDIYRQALSIADRLYLTRVHAQVEGDTRFPPIVESRWRTVASDRREADDHHEFAYTFLVLERLGDSEP